MEPEVHSVTVLPDGDPRRLRLGWVVREELGPISVGTQLLMPSILGWHVVMLRGDRKFARHFGSTFTRRRLSSINRLTSIIPALSAWPGDAVGLESTDDGCLWLGGGDHFGWSPVTSDYVKHVRVTSRLGMTYGDLKKYVESLS